MSEYVKELSDSNFDQEVLAADRPVLVDFWAVWCGPCRAIAPAVEAVAETFASTAIVAKLNIDDSPMVPQRYGVRAIPTLILFKGGEEVERIVGSASKGSLSQLIQKHVAEQEKAASQ
jgi:thioredoxin 1